MTNSGIITHGSPPSVESIAGKINLTNWIEDCRTFSNARIFFVICFIHYSSYALDGISRKRYFSLTELIIEVFIHPDELINNNHFGRVE